MIPPGAPSGCGGGLGAAEEEGPHGDVPPAELPVVLADDAVEPGDEDDCDEEGEGRADADDETGRLAAVHVQLNAAALPDEQHAEERGGDAEVDGDGHQTAHHGVAAEHDGVLGDHEDDGTKGT